MDEQLARASVGRQLAGACHLQAFNHRLRLGERKGTNEVAPKCAAVKLYQKEKPTGGERSSGYVQVVEPANQPGNRQTHRLAGSIVTHNQRQRLVEFNHILVVGAERADACSRAMLQTAVCKRRRIGGRRQRRRAVGRAMTGIKMPTA